MVYARFLLRERWINHNAFPRFGRTRASRPALSCRYSRAMRPVFAVLLLLPALALAQSLAITGVTVVDTTGGAPRPGMTVVIEGERIVGLGPAGEIAVPEKARVVQGAGKFLIPGLWDM